RNCLCADAGNRHLMNRVFVLVASLRIDPVKRYHHIVTKYPRRRSRGVKHSEIRRRADNDERPTIPFIQLRLKLAIDKFIKAVRIEDGFRFSSLERRGDLTK